MADYQIETLEAVVAAHGDDPSGLVTALREREDLIAAAIRDLAVTRLGLHAPIVAQVFTNVFPMFGTTADDETRMLVHQQYLTHMETLRRQSGED